MAFLYWEPMTSTRLIRKAHTQIWTKSRASFHNLLFSL